MNVPPVKKKTYRNSNFEILRILAILFIIVSHYSFHGGFSFGAHIIPPANEIMLRFSVLGNLGVDIFIIISGYFLVYSKKVNPIKLISLIAQVWTYSFLIYVIFVVTGKEQFSVLNFAKSCLPLTTSKYWFATAYILFLVLSPFINRMLTGLSKREYQCYLFTMIVILCIIPTITTFTPLNNEFTRFLLVYSLGAYLRIWPIEYNNVKKIGFFLVLGNLFIMLLASFVYVLVPSLGKIISDWGRFFQPWSFTVLGASVGLLMPASSFKEHNNRVINSIAGCTFGIYLLHDNPITREFLWNDVFKNATYEQSSSLALHMLLAVGGVFIIGLCVEFIRQKTLEKVVIKGAKLINSKVYSKYISN